jgi:predicted acyl esterase
MQLFPVMDYLSVMRDLKTIAAGSLAWLALVAGISGLAGVSNAQSVVDTTIVADDGTLLDATITMPSGVSPTNGFPGIVLVHGYGRNKDDMQSIAALLSLNGYSALAYSVRGQGTSGGLSTTTGPRERQDLLDVIQFYRGIPGINKDTLAVAGGSQGGIHAWMAATYRMPGVRTIATLIAPPQFASALAPNGCVKERLVYELTLDSVRYDPERDRIKDFIVRDQYDSMRVFIDIRDLDRLVDSIQVPVIQALGWADILFPVNSSLSAAGRLAGRGIPVWSYYGTNGHGEPENQDQSVFLLGKILSWFDRWLKGKPLDQDTQPLVFYADDRPGWPISTITRWPPTPAGSMRLYFSMGGLTALPPASDGTVPFSVVYSPSYTPLDGWNDRYSGPRFAEAFKSSPATFLSPPLLDTADVTGIPMVHLLVGSDALKFQSNIRLYDVWPGDSVWQLISRGAYGIRNNQPGKQREVDIACNALSHRIPPGHRIGAVITSLDLTDSSHAYIVPYFLTSHSGISPSPATPSYIDVPLVGTAHVLGVSEKVENQPAAFMLFQNYPNPFNPTTEIRYNIEGIGGQVRLGLYDILGREVRVLVNERKGPGSYTVNFNANGLASGVYFYKITSGEISVTKKLVVLR